MIPQDCPYSLALFLIVVTGIIRGCLITSSFHDGFLFTERNIVVQTHLDTECELATYLPVPIEPVTFSCVNVDIGLFGAAGGCVRTVHCDYTWMCLS